MSWRKANGRYSITNGEFNLIVPYQKPSSRGFAQVDAVLEYLNSLEPRREPVQKICADCGEVMRKGHKYIMTSTDRRGVYVLHHRNCQNPQSYS